MIKIIYFFIFIILSGCSLNNNSNFWSSAESIKKEINDNNETKIKELFKKDEVFDQEFNPNLKVSIKGNFSNTTSSYTNNTGRVKFSGNLKNLSRYKFSKIKNFYQYEPEIIFHKEKSYLLEVQCKLAFLYLRIIK